MTSVRGYVGVVGPSGAVDASLSQAAEEVGHLVGSAQWSSPAAGPA